jgi:tRNA pseudouridine55 synthase
VDGLLIVDKPSGPTSHDVVARVRRALGEPRVGHTGTLDPLASGVLPLVIGRATRLARFIASTDKTYHAVVRLGARTDTADAEGRIVGPAHTGALPGREAIDRALDAFQGVTFQQPPRYSAKKIAGRRSYALARAGRARSSTHGSATALEVAPAVEMVDAPLPAPVQVCAHGIEITGLDGADVALTVRCSAGFYVRSLANDLGEALGVGAHLAALRRVRTGTFDAEHAIALDDLERAPDEARRRLLSMSHMLSGFPAVWLTPEGLRRTLHGLDVRPVDVEQGREAGPIGPDGCGEGAGPEDIVRLLSEGDDLVAIAVPNRSSGLLHPSIVLR